MKKLGERDIRNNATEAYRFIYNIVYGDYLILTVIAQNNFDSLRFSSRVPNKADLLCTVVQSEKVLRSSKQSLTEKEYSQFKAILDGTYYWQMINQPCWDGMIRDGNTAKFESRSYMCVEDSLVYRSVYLAPLSDGSFKDAFSYLLKRAAPFKGNIAAQRAILEKMKSDR